MLVMHSGHWKTLTKLLDTKKRREGLRVLPFSIYGGMFMNRHQVQGYQTNFTNDIYHVEEQLQAYDPTLYIMYNQNDGTWLIMDGITELAIMRLPQKGFETLDSRVVSHIKKIHTANGFSASWELQQAEERRQKELDRQLGDIAYNYAKDMERPVKELAYYGNAG